MTRQRHTNLADVLLQRAADDSADVLIFEGGDGKRDRVSGAQLLERAQRAAAVLRANGVAAGDRVLLMMTAQADFVDTFFGAIWADAIPVPLFPPIFSRRPQDFIANFGRIATSSGARVIVASDELIGPLEAFADQLRGLHIVPRSSCNDSSERLEEVPTRALTDLALLQYTSGSTGSPKGVALSHANVIANMQAIGCAVELNEDDVGVSWLPLYHDMGLIGVLATLYRGGRVVMLSPLDFAKDPAIWLRTISEHGGTLSPAPNFAYSRCLRLAENDIADLDLSTWRVAFNGAEPVDPDTLLGFIERFAPHGFDPAAFYPVYGLAEHTLAVSFPSLGQGAHMDTVDRRVLSTSKIAEPVPEDHPDAVRIVSVGTPLEGVSVEIRDERAACLTEGHVGEVCVKSASVMSGYFQDAAATAEVLDNGWLKTGDLGYLREGMLYITGRIKDLIIRAGRNFYPTDIESAATGIPGVRAGRAAAFSIPVDGDEEHLIVVAESDVSCEQQRSELTRRIAAAVAAKVGFRPERVELCERGMLPITSSGKLRRRVARARFLTEARVRASIP